MLTKKIVKNPSKKSAIYGSYTLVILALLLSLIILPLIESSPNHSEYLISIMFAVASLDIVSDLVGGSIDDSAKDLISEKIRGYDSREIEQNDTISKLQIEIRKREKEISDLKEEVNEVKNSLGLQEINFTALIPPQQRYHLPSQAHFQVGGLDEPSLDDRREEVLARKAISKGLFLEDRLFIEIALTASLHALDKSHLNSSEVKKEICAVGSKMKTLTDDISIYLKAWMLLSIDFGRYMDVSKIAQRYPNRNNPETSKYIKALNYVKHSLIKNNRLEEKIDDRYIKRARLLLQDHLSYLIRQLELNSVYPVRVSKHRSSK
ncbi:MAG: hypothetical protein AAF329_04940 [Cyanobacteria bacterium P01_A01_bin.17]